MQRFQRWIVVAIVIAISLASILYVQGNMRQQSDLQISEVAKKVKNAEVDKLVVDGDNVRVQYRDKNRPAQQSRKESASSLIEQLTQYGVTNEQRDALKIEVSNGTN